MNVPRLDLLARVADTGRLVNIEFQTTNEEWLLGDALLAQVRDRHGDDSPGA